ncbi:hypothetical protein [Methylotenera sp.]|uniref:hypothetical protein n=1 Tax=Methylotenera sp. TaxID=2051956 RepID=UPI002489DFE7|nr:hypothetical protein [Methylotenera sp.]MDI1360826.1 hypothetical protein [Methylotenera sp.]
MNAKYRVKMIVTASGERLPILLAPDGLPIFEPNVFTLSEVRSKNRASNTIDSYLKSITIFLLFLDLRNINLEERLNVGQLLSLGEIEELVGICRLPIDRIYTVLNDIRIESAQKTSTVRLLESLRSRSTLKGHKNVGAPVAATRLRNIRDYLKWLCSDPISNHGVAPSFRMSLALSCQNTSNAIEARLPSVIYKYSTVDPREGLATEDVNVELHSELTHLAI